MKKFLTLIFVLLLFVALKINYFIYAAPVGNYLQLNGGYVSASSALNNSPSAITLEVWIKPTNTGGVQKIISIGEKNVNKLHYELGINGGSLSLSYKYDIGSLKVITAGNIAPNVWNHIAVVISASQTTLYINGAQIFTTNGANNLLPISDSIVVGRSYTQTSFDTQLYKGDIDEVRISDTTRNVPSLWNSNAYNGALSADANTILLWHLDEIRGQTSANDVSDNHLNGQLVGSDSQIHFFGILPSPTPFSLFVLPTIRWSRPVLPTIGFPGNNNSSPTPTQTQNNNPFPTSSIDIRSNRPVYPR